MIWERRDASGVPGNGMTWRAGAASAGAGRMANSAAASSHARAQAPTAPAGDTIFTRVSNGRR